MSWGAGPAPSSPCGSVGRCRRRKAAPQGTLAYGIGHERLGHATIAITLDTYSHAIPALQEEAAVIAELVFAEPAATP